MSNWVSVNDRVPTTDTDYLTMCAGELTLAWYDGRRWNPSGAVDTSYDESSVVLEGSVTYWLEGLEIPTIKIGN